MCIIVAKYKGVNMPSKSILKNCFNNNPDGAGIMISAKGKVWGFKGLMSFEAFEAKLTKLEKRFGNLKNRAVVMHFRIGTHGSNIPENTHPFPLSDSYDDLRELEWTASQGVAHNGVISSCSYCKDIKVENVSDTMVFVKRVAAPIAKFNHITKQPSILDALGFVADSKLCFMDGKDNIVTYGKFERDNGVLYSNSTYYAYTPKYEYWGLDEYLTYDTKYDSKHFWLSDSEKKQLKAEIADDYGLWFPFIFPFRTIENGIEYHHDMLDEFALDPATDEIYIWSDAEFDWIPHLDFDEYEPIEEDDDAED